MPNPSELERQGDGDLGDVALAAIRDRQLFWLLDRSGRGEQAFQLLQHDIPALLTEVARLRAERDDLRRQLAEARAALAALPAE